MPVLVRNLNDLMTDLSQRLVDNASVFQLPLLPNDMNQGSRFYLWCRATMSMFVDFYRELAEIEEGGNPATARGEALSLITSAWGVLRNEGTASHGNVVVTPRTLGNTGTAFAGQTITYNDDINFVVIAETVLSPTSATLVPIEAVSVGRDGNLKAGLILESNDTVLENDFLWRVGDQGLNLAGDPVGDFFGGSDYEEDADLRDRFFKFLQSLSRATVLAVQQAIAGITGLVSISFSNIDPLPGFFTIYVDDGSVGTDPEAPNLTSTNRTRIQAVLDEWAAAGVVGRIKAIRKQLTDVTIQVLVDPIYASSLVVTNPASTVASDVATRITNYMATLPLNTPLYLSRIYDIAHNAPGVLKVTITLPTADVVPTTSAAVRPGTISVSGVIATT